MIHVSYGLHDRDGHYSKFVGTSMTSIFENTREEITIHILHDQTLTPDNRDKLNYVAGKYNQRIKFYNVAALMPDRLKFLTDKIPAIAEGRFSVGTFYRLLMTELMPKHDVERIIYLDADILVNLDIAELWFVKLDGKPIAAVPEVEATFGHMVENKHIITSGRVKDKDYFNAGVLLIDLNALNQSVENLFVDGITFLADNPKCECFDQDILNNYFSTNCVKLPSRFDYFVQAERAFIKANRLERAIYHYAGNEINFDMKNVFSKLFFEHFMRTPWFSTETIGLMFDYLRRMNMQMKAAIQQMSSLLVRKSRAFYIDGTVVQTMKKIWGVLDSEEVITTAEPDSLNKLLRSMRAEQGKKFYFIIVKNYKPLHERLTQAGLKQGTDYINARSLLSERQGGMPVNAYEFIKRM